MITEPLIITFTRAGGGEPELKTVMRDAVLDAEDEHAWLGTERPYTSKRHPHEDASPMRYRLEFRRGSERRVVDIRHDDLDAHLRPLVDRLTRLAEQRLR